MTNSLKYRTALFWDIAPDQIDQALISSRDWVIFRVFEYGSIQDIRQVINLYGETSVKNVLASYPMPRITRSMAYLFLDIDPQNRYAV